MQPMYEYRIIKEEINTQVAFPQNGLGDTMPDFAMVQPLEVITNYKVQVKGSFFFWHDVKSFKFLRRAIEFKKTLETFADAKPDESSNNAKDDEA